MFCVNWRFRRICSSSWVTSLMDISKLKSWNIIHSTIDIRFSSLPGRLGALLMKSVIFWNSLIENISSVVCRLESEIRLLYCVNRLLTRISFLSLLNTPNPSCEVCKWVINFSRSMYSASLVSRSRLYIWMICCEISPSSLCGKADCISVSTGSFLSARLANSRS